MEVAATGGWPAGLARGLGLQNGFRVVEHEVEIARWPEVPPLRFAFASDLHAGPTTHPHFLEEVCRGLAERRPDVLFLGGDYVFLRGRYVDALADLLGSVPAPLGRFAVLGNHDLWADDVRIVRSLERAGVQVLVNRSVRLPPPYDGVHVCGIDDAGTGSPDVEAAFSEADGVRIFLTHCPRGIRLAAGHRFELALCGHTHGGHVALPGGVPIYLPPACLGRSLAHGRHRIDGPEDRILIVSRGVGHVSVPIRLNAAPDVLVGHLRSRRARPGAGAGGSK